MSSLRAPILRVAVGIWFLATVVVPGLCANLCSSATCSTPVPVSAPVQKMANCCGHCGPAKCCPPVGNSVSGCKSNCTCNVGALNLTIKPSKVVFRTLPRETVLTALPDVPVLTTGPNDPVQIPAYTAGAPPGAFPASVHSRAPPSLAFPSKLA